MADNVQSNLVTARRHVFLIEKKELHFLKSRLLSSITVEAGYHALRTSLNSSKDDNNHDELWDSGEECVQGDGTPTTSRTLHLAESGMNNAGKP